jgi:carboxypeptidase C (cathepsin A)
LHNETYDLVSERRTVLEDGAPVPEQNATFLTGRSSSGDIRSTASGSVNGAIASWHFLQTWFQEFPQYLPNDTRISLAAMSYGGRYGPAMMSFWEEQNSRIENGTWDDGERQPTILYLDTLMLFNGCIDRFTEYPHYPSQASRGNGYGIEAVNETTYQGMVEAVPECLKRLRSCHDVAAILDPENTGINAAVSAVCRSADDFCLANIMGPGFLSGRHPSDLSVIPQTHGSAPSLIRTFLNRDWVQRELGASRNWTEISGAVYNAFISMSDMPRNTGLEDLAYLLNNGIKVSLVHGDLDFLCPVSPFFCLKRGRTSYLQILQQWQGGDAVAKAINWTGSAGYASAQYADLQTNDDYSGGLVRQYGNLSYIRAYRAGHGVPYAQRETAYKIFERALFNLDIATGTQSTAGSIEAAYRSTGRDVMDVQLSLPTTSPD